MRNGLGILQEIRRDAASALRRLLPAVVWLAGFAAASAQNPAPAPPQAHSILLTGGTVHTGTGAVIANGAVGFRDGKLTLVADASVIRLQAGAYDTIIDVSGRQVYPGLIALNTIIGLSELEAVRATRDFDETGRLNPSVRSLIAYDTDSRVTPTVRANGVLLAEVVPQGGLVTGTSSVMMLDGWNWEDAVYRADIGVHLNWPDMNVRTREKPEEEEKQRRKIEAQLTELRRLFDDARAYARRSDTLEKNLHLDAMRGLFDGSRKLFVHADYVRQIVAAVDFCRGYGLPFVLVGGRDAWRVAGLLAEHHVPVVLAGTHVLPLRPDEDVDIAYRRPYLLRQGGVDFCISVGGFWQVRNLSYQAGTGAAYGLTKEEALAAVTSAPARIAGIDRTTGSLEEGKDATLLVADGDLLDMRASTVRMAFIRGRRIDLDNMQLQLYRKYLEKYHLPE